MALKSINISGNFDWCPFKKHKNYLACFTSHNLLYSNGNNLNNYVYLLDINLNSDGRSLEIVSKLNFEEALKSEKSGKKKGTNEYVTSFEWINSSSFVESEGEDELGKGIIVGGLTNGDVILLNAQNLFLEKPTHEQFILSKANVHEGSINCLECNKHKNHLIATGGNDGQLFITDIENILSPTSYDPYLDKNNLQKITCLNWNKKVSHILATSSNNGNTIIWDLKIKKSAVSFRDPHSRTKTSSLAWLANQPTQILVAYDDEKSPCLQLWDLRNANYPIKEIIGHSKGINNITFSSIDTNLLISSGKDTTKCWYLSNNNFDVYNEVNNSANNIYSKWSPFIPDMFASATNMDTIQINSINNGMKMTTKYVPSFYRKDAGITFGFGGKICFFDNTTGGDPTKQGQSDGSDVGGGSGVSAPENRFPIKCHIYPTEMELISEADKFEKYIASGDYFEFCESKIATTEDEYEKLTWRILQLLCTSQKEGIVKHLGYDMNEIVQKIQDSTGKQPGFIFNKLAEEQKEKMLSKNSSSFNLLGPDSMMDYSGAGLISGAANYEPMNGGFMAGGAASIAGAASVPPGGGSPMGIDTLQGFNASLDVDPEKFFRELGEKKENEEAKQEGEKQKGSKAAEGEQQKGSKAMEEKQQKEEKGEKKGKDKGKKKGKGPDAGLTGVAGEEYDDKDDEGAKEDKTGGRKDKNQTNDETNWNSGIESIIKECVLVGNIETAVELCLHKNRMADALFLSSFGGEQLWHKTKTLYIQKQNSTFMRSLNYILDDQLELLVQQIDLSSWGEALSILCTYALNKANFNNLCETLAKRLQNEKFDIRAASICYLCASNFDQTVQIWNDMPSTQSSLLNVLQDMVEKMTVLKMAIKHDMFNAIMNRKINQYAELLANSGRLKAAMTFLCLTQEDQTEESLILRDRIFNSGAHMLSHQVKPPMSPFQVLHVKSTAAGMLHQNYHQGNQSPQFKSNVMGGGILNPSQSNVFSPTKSATSMIVPPPMPGQITGNITGQMPRQVSGHIPGQMQMGYSSMPPTKFSTQVISSPPSQRASFASTSSKNFPMGNLNPVKPPSMSTMSASYMMPPSGPPPSATCPIGTSPPSYASMSNLSNFVAPPGIKSEQDDLKQNTPTTGVPLGAGGGPMFPPQSYANQRRIQPGGNVPPPAAPTPSQGNQMNNRGFPSMQNIAPLAPPGNRNPSISSNPSSMSFQQDNSGQQFLKRECMDQQAPYGGAVSPPGMQPNSFGTSFQDSTNKVGLGGQSAGPPSSGLSTTSPIAGALTVTPGMPVPWPIPTTTQQLGSTTTSTANENKKIQTATKEQNGVFMGRSNVDNVKKTISSFLNGYTSQEPMKKKAEDVSVKVHELFDKLDTGSFNQQINDSIVNMVNALNANDFRAANKVIVDLSRNLWDGSNKSWIMGLKCIIPKC
ncbi:hypothetical protein C922_02756 [Plasmodium inui San Antonio 1]|uniref:Sec16 Sec23-binding domain-containing protein n=1 Tax=Plasmodium inui San Antonio 1 TaxID=1237626 RepID=W7AN82_9APIC|nr:hypothetical protein C922_02756 [Plasmodium inui San Antonio 1]EUD66771.1 hypothetical protein C922_02756 [Plasmodium inui San Antonio 1]